MGRLNSLSVHVSPRKWACDVVNFSKIIQILKTKKTKYVYLKLEKKIL